MTDYTNQETGVLSMLLTIRYIHFQFGHKGSWNTSHFSNKTMRVHKRSWEGEKKRQTEKKNIKRHGDKSHTQENTELCWDVWAVAPSLDRQTDTFKKRSYRQRSNSAEYNSGLRTGSQ